MATENNPEASKTKRLCYHCIGEEYLHAEVKRDGQRRRCSYCNRTRRSYTIDALAERFEEVFQEHFVRTSDQPDSWQHMMLSDRESNYEWERDGEPVVQAIANSADIPYQAAEDIQSVLDNKYSDFEAETMGEETDFSCDTYYAARGTSDRAWLEEWGEFERKIKTEARFFSRTAVAHLTSIFQGAEEMCSSDGRPLVVDAGPGSALNAVYRARAFQADERLKEALCYPAQHLGSPPSSLAVGGRMNARGISVFYGASEALAAIAEVRPPVGSQIAVARFEIIRPLRLLDLTALSDVAESGSIFDPGLARRMERAMFLRSLSQRITRPVMPDEEASEYLATQAIADFLATENEPRLDGIIYPSVQAAGDVLNVVFFHKAARVEAIATPEGTEIEASTGQLHEEGWEFEYSVVEQVPPTEEGLSDSETQDRPPDFMPIMWGPIISADADYREPALRIDPQSIKVHQVKGVKFETDEFDVIRHRWEKRDPDL